MTPISQDPVELRIAETAKPMLFVDEAELGEIVVRTIHRAERLETGRTRISYRIEISGLAADTLGPAIGPQMSGTSRRYWPSRAGRSGRAGGESPHLRYRFG